MVDFQHIFEFIKKTCDLAVVTITSDKFLAVLVIFFIMILYDVLKRGWKNSLTEKFIKGSFTSLGILLVNSLIFPITYFGIAYLQTLYESIGIPHLSHELWVGFPILLVAFIGIIAHDFADYWNHRAMHHRWVWPIHAIHHSDEEVNALTTYRVHAFEVLFMKGSYIVLLSWLGIPAEAAVLGTALLMCHNAYVHANLDWDHGPFKLLIASPKFHRWHHANDKRAFGKNLANVMPLYDYMFGTYYEPDHCNVPMGADGVPHSDLLELMLFPFRAWYSMSKRALKKLTHSQNETPQINEKQV